MRLLVVDDSRSSLALIGSILSDMAAAEIDLCLSPREGLERCAEQQYDLVVVDHVMPEMDGVAFTAALRGRTEYGLVPIIMVTSDAAKEIRIEAIRAGASDFLNKPFDPTELQARVANLLALRRAQVELADRANWLAREVERATAHLLAREEEVIWRLARAIEYRDGDTGGHVSRVAQISQLIAEGIGLSPHRCRTIYLAAPLHDIGKIGIADMILLKPGRLTPEEMTVMRQHAAIGHRILANSDIPLLRLAAEIALSHHEKFDGSGYPNGLAGNAIPLSGRIVAIADVFDALTSTRPYKRSWTVEEARRFMVEQRGRHFDPALLDAFLSRWNEVCAIHGGNVDELPKMIPEEA